MGSGGTGWTGAALALVGFAALLGRRHRPVLTLAVVLAALVVSQAMLRETTGLEIAAVLALYAVAAYSPARAAWFSLAGLLAVFAGALAVWPSALVSVNVADGTEVALSPAASFVIALSTTFALAMIALMLGTTARGRRLHIAALVERAAQLALERDQSAQIALVAERNRIAREMHDVVAHSLSVMVTLADGARASLTKRPDQAAVALDELAATGRSALADTRRLLGVLRDDDAGEGGAPLAPQPLNTDLTDVIARFQAAGVPVSLTESGPALPADAGLQLAVFRIVQEALTNVLRHAPGSPRIDVTIDRQPGYVVVEVDNADGARPASTPGGRGLVGMRERAAVYDGHVEAGPTPGGWRVRAVLRWAEEGEL
ncbi:two-component sensor histidine kinase [Georgenia sp. 311]|uniref:histidine kinase n=1 Tax=Georgenia wutianyii TaxID=2585135 RepID=A0ABX5VJQ2_9MICO|nr:MULTISPECIES: histidine kinase [Georgenia]QDB78333.1 two-component sensor histidine kinase [Georgenia wutianyii]TNC20024.1 two-component sensor histidine kinase [Georgenia sp. 311]